MEPIFNEIAQRVPTDGGTYTGDDGLLHCKKCGGKRQTRVEAFGKVRVVNCLCHCMAEQMEHEEEKQKQLDKLAMIQRYRDAGFPDSQLKHCTFDVDDGTMPTITNAMMAYVNHFHEFRKDGKGLLLYGNVGTGKSFFAACAVNALIDKGYPCLMTNFSRLTNQMSELWEGRQGYIDSLTRHALVAIDDLGVERDTEYMSEQITTIIDSLYRARTPLIITSNYSPAQLTKDCPIRQRRVYSRLLERCHPIKIDGNDRRKEKGRADYKNMKKILGV